MSANGVRKPTQSHSRGSDRRQASGRKAASYLLRPNAPTVVRPTSNSSNSTSNSSQNVGKTVRRSNGTTQWEDSSLLEWDPTHFRLFVGNLGQDATDQMLAEAFGKYATMSKVKIPIDKKTNKNKGYGFVAFADADDYFKAFQEMNGKYIGLHPVQLKRAETKIKPAKRSRR